MSRKEEARLLQALRHPVRRDILRRMHEERNAFSPKDLSDELGIDLGKSAYHCRVLAGCEAIALVDAKPVRGALQHFYRFDIEAEWVLAALGLSADGKLKD